MFGLWEILILVGVLVLIFGAKGAPAMARRLGTGVREMKDAVSEMDPRGVIDAKPSTPAARPMPALEAGRSEAFPAAEAAPVADATAAADGAPDASGASA